MPEPSRIAAWRRCRRGAHSIEAARPVHVEELSINRVGKRVAGLRTGDFGQEAAAHRAQLRVVQLTDWLPPEFSAVSQYVVAMGEARARMGADVVIIGLSSSERAPRAQHLGPGTISVIAVTAAPFDRRSWSRRLLWTAGTNLRLLARAWPHMRRADEIRFTGSPPFLLHFLSAANLVLRKKLVYRITDFYPECVIAALKRKSRPLEWLLKLTNVLRRRVESFEAIGRDMEKRLVECGVDPRRISLSRDQSPVEVGPGTSPLPRPAELAGRKTILYSGNWGVAHDIGTFLEGYRRHHKEGRGSVILWLNATGSGAEELDRRLRAEGLPFHRQRLVPLKSLANLLVTPDAHLVTLRSEFMGYVLPSKIYGCIASRRPVLYVGPRGSDVHRLCTEQADLPYRQIEVGDAAAVADALAALGQSGTVAGEAALHREKVALPPDER